jgi:hypothetical protein
MAEKYGPPVQTATRVDQGRATAINSLPVTPATTRSREPVQAYVFRSRSLGSSGTRSSVVVHARNGGTNGHGCDAFDATHVFGDAATYSWQCLSDASALSGGDCLPRDPPATNRSCCHLASLKPFVSSPDHGSSRALGVPVEYLDDLAAGSVVDHNAKSAIRLVAGR